MSWFVVQPSSFGGSCERDEGNQYRREIKTNFEELRSCWVGESARRRGGLETWYVAEKVSWSLTEIRNRWKGKGQFISSLLNPSRFSMVRFSGLTDKNPLTSCLVAKMWHHLYQQVKMYDLVLNFQFSLIFHNNLFKTNCKLRCYSALYRRSQVI